MPLAAESDLQTFVQISNLFEMGDQQIEIIFDDRENLRVRFERDSGPVLSCFFAFRQVTGGFSPHVILAVHPTLTTDFSAQVRRQRVHYRPADTVQAAGDLVSATAELPAGVQSGHHSFQSALAGLCVFVNRNAAPVVDHRYPAVLGDRDVNAFAVTGHSLVDRVIQDLIDQVVQAALVGASDVHSRTDAHGLQAL